MSGKYGHSFRFQVDGKTMFRDNMKTKQCLGKNKRTGERCTRNSCIGLGYCWSHLESNKYLRIKESDAEKGYGLFASNGKGNNDVIFKANEKICDYDGEIVTKHQLDTRYGDHTAPYGIEINKTKDIYEDGALHRGIGTMANHAPIKHTNAKLSVNKTRTRATLRATRPIRNGKEILVNYGKDYRFHNGITIKTRYGKKLKQRTQRNYH